MATKQAGERPGRIAQIRAVAALLRRHNPRALPLVALAALGTLAVFVIIALVTGALLYTLPLGVLSAIAVGFIVFGQLAQRTQYAMLDGQPGAAAAILEGMRGNWTVTPAVAGNRNMDVVHRVVGRPGVVLVGEGASNRLPHLLAAEKKRVARVAYDVPIYDIQVGNEEDQVTLRKLQTRIMRLPRNLRSPDIVELNSRLKALPSTAPVPKGPMPKNVRLPRGGQMRRR
ncbi:MAG: DUF4191 family protein [Streptosporangiales bacterium]|nr:DUF4191 family protein [Streptosporangiales bacterium]